MKLWVDALVLWVAWLDLIDAYGSVHYSETLSCSSTVWSIYLSDPCLPWWPGLPVDTREAEDLGYHLLINTLWKITGILSLSGSWNNGLDSVPTQTLSMSVPSKKGSVSVPPPSLFCLYKKLEVSHHTGLLSSADKCVWRIQMTLHGGSNEGVLSCSDDEECSVDGSVKTNSNSMCSVKRAVLHTVSPGRFICVDPLTIMAQLSFGHRLYSHCQRELSNMFWKQPKIH